MRCVRRFPFPSAFGAFLPPRLSGLSSPRLSGLSSPSAFGASPFPPAFGAFLSPRRSGFPSHLGVRGFPFPSAFEAFLPPRRSRFSFPARSDLPLLFACTFFLSLSHLYPAPLPLFFSSRPADFLSGFFSPATFSLALSLLPCASSPLSFFSPCGFLPPTFSRPAVFFHLCFSHPFDRSPRSFYSQRSSLFSRLAPFLSGFFTPATFSLALSLLPCASSPLSLFSPRGFLPPIFPRPAVFFRSRFSHPFDRSPRSFGSQRSSLFSRLAPFLLPPSLSPAAFSRSLSSLYPATFSLALSLLPCASSPLPLFPSSRPADFFLFLLFACDFRRPARLNRCTYKHSVKRFSAPSLPVAQLLSHKFLKFAYSRATFFRKNTNICLI